MSRKFNQIQTVKSMFCFLLSTGITFAALIFPSIALSSDACDIIDDVASVYKVKERSIMLMQHGDFILRAADGKIRCEPVQTNERLVCILHGKAEMFIEGGERAARVIVYKSEQLGEAHLYPSGDLSCGLQEDFR